MNRLLVAVIACVGWGLAACSAEENGTNGSGGAGGGSALDGAAGTAIGGAAGSGASGGAGPGGTSGTGGVGGVASDGAAGSATGGTETGGTATAGMGFDAALVSPDSGTTEGRDAASRDAAAGDSAASLCTAGEDCCPADPMKTQPGQCGCGELDFDYDMDGVADCNDPCPLHLKPTPGVCGCDMPDVDTDGDGALDCNDKCPKNPGRSVLGACGCTLPDTAAPACLAHRYSFNDGTAAAGTATVRDSVGTANGTAMNVLLRGTGTLTLAGGQTDQYVALPSGIISALGDSATFEGWITWTGTGAWQRIFDFGNADPTMPGVQSVGTAFVFLTPLSGAGGALFTVNTVGLTEAAAPAFFPPGTAGAAPHHFAAVVDASGATARLYIDGTLAASAPLTATLSGLADVNNWLGRAQFVTDPEFGGVYYEFRIHTAAMTQAQITASIAAGPDALP